MNFKTILYLFAFLFWAYAILWVIGLFRIKSCPSTISKWLRTTITIMKNVCFWGFWGYIILYILGLFATSCPGPTPEWVRTRGSMAHMSYILSGEMQESSKPIFRHFVSNMRETQVSNKMIDDEILYEMITNNGMSNRFFVRGKYMDSWEQPVRLSVILNDGKTGVLMHSYGENKTNDYGDVDDIVDYYELTESRHFSSVSSDKVTGVKTNFFKVENRLY